MTQGQDIGAVLSSSVVLIRPDPAALDPWYLAGLLSSSDSGRQATRMASTLGDTVRFDPRRVRIPVLPIEDQRTHGAAFRRLAERVAPGRSREMAPRPGIRDPPALTTAVPARLTARTRRQAGHDGDEPAERRRHGNQARAQPTVGLPHLHERPVPHGPGSTPPSDQERPCRQPGHHAEENRAGTEDQP